MIANFKYFLYLHSFTSFISLSTCRILFNNSTIFKELIHESHEVEKVVVKRDFKRISKPEYYDEIVREAELAWPEQSDDIVEAIPNARAGTTDLNLRWPGNKMIVELHIGYNRRKVKQIMSALYTLQEAMECFEFDVLPKGEKAPLDVDSVFLSIAGSDCSSLLGRQGSKQTIFVGVACNLYGTLMHEMMHALGFHHEHVRPDRDEYVTISTDFPDEDTAYQYKIQPDQMYFVDEYDFDSIMHYGFNRFLQPKPDMVPEGVNVGQRDHLSKADVERLRGMYPCS